MINVMLIVWLNLRVQGEHLISRFSWVAAWLLVTNVSHVYLVEEHCYFGVIYLHVYLVEEHYYFGVIYLSYGGR